MAAVQRVLLDRIKEKHPQSPEVNASILYGLFGALAPAGLAYAPEAAPLPTAPSDSPVWLGQPPTLCQSFLFPGEMPTNRHLSDGLRYTSGGITSRVSSHSLKKKKDRGETKHWALPSLVSARGEITEIITAIFQLYGRVEFQQLQLNNMYAL